MERVLCSSAVLQPQPPPQLKARSLDSLYTLTIRRLVLLIVINFRVEDL